MCGNPLSTLTRLFTLSVIAFGGGLVAYAIWFAAKAHSFGAPSGIALALGLVDVLMGLVVVTCGYKKLFALRLFLLVNGLVLIGELVVCVLFAIPSQQATIIDKMQLDPDVKAWVQDHIQTATYILAGAIAAKAVTFVLIMLQTCAVARGSRFDEDGYDTLDPATGKKLSKKERKEKAALLAEERIKQMEEAATARAREKNSSLYEKYGIIKK